MKYLLIYTNHQQESAAHQVLLRLGLISFLPMIYRDKKINKNTSKEPMFPRYLFVAFKEGQDDMHAIKTAQGVTNVVYYGSSPAYAANELIESIKAKQDENGITDIWKDYEENEEIRIKSGIFQDYDGYFLSRKSNERVAIMLKDSAQKLTLQKKDIEPKH